MTGLPAEQGPSAAAPAGVGLADGAVVTVRPVEPADKPLLASAFDALSDESRHRRFFAALRELSPAPLAYLTEVDHHDHEALLAIEPSTGACVGVARLVRIGPQVAEPAIVVSDGWQRLGLGSALLDALATRACAEGITRFSATVLAENTDAIRLLERLGATAASESGPEMRFDVALPDGGGAGRTLRELLSVAAAGLLTPARVLLQRMAVGDE
ncbi:MAG: GNAT family N-acetyltransferase [Solirubrobacteraceae bacterium]|jgi:acetyltransferase